VRIVVVLPAPLGPRTQYTEPLPTAKSTPSTALTEPKVFTRPEASTASVECGVNVFGFLAPEGPRLKA
jgi:hypothetical protein